MSDDERTVKFAGDWTAYTSDGAIVGANELIGYARVSYFSDDPTIQLEALESWAGEHGYTLAAVYIDHGVKSTTSWHDRPAMKQAITHLLDSKATALAVWRLDRIARDPAVFATISSLLRSNGKRIVTTELGEHLPTEEWQRVERMLVDAARIEREAVEQRFKVYRRLLIARQGYAGGKLRVGDGSSGVEPRQFGMNPPRRIKGRLRAIPRADEQAVIAQMIAMREQGASWYAIADWANEEGIPTVTGTAKWSARFVSKVVKRGLARPSALQPFGNERGDAALTQRAPVMSEPAKVHHIRRSA